MAVDSELLNIDVEIKNANVVKNIVLAALGNDGIITEEQFNEYKDNYHVIVVKKSWFRTLFDKLTNKEDGYVFKIVKFSEI